MSEMSKRRWLTFRLRTLLVVAVPLGALVCWSGNQLKWVVDRYRFENQWPDALEYHEAFPECAVPVRGVGPASDLPWVLRLLGEEGVDGFLFDHGTPIDVLQQARRLFPEAAINELRAGVGVGIWE